MNCKRKGNRNEHRSIRLLEAAGYACTRAAASLGVFDVVAVGSQDIILLQVKSNEWPRSVEMEQIKLFAAPPNARKLIHRWRDRQAVPDVREVP
jgi:Holliday junction resolvase